MGTSVAWPVGPSIDEMSATVREGLLEALRALDDGVAAVDGEVGTLDRMSDEAFLGYGRGAHGA